MQSSNDQRSSSADISSETGKRHLLILIALTMAFSCLALSFKVATAGIDQSRPSFLRIPIEVLMWVWLWNGSNAARIIWFVLFILGLLIGVVITLFGLAVVFTGSSTRGPFADGFIIAAVVAFSALSAYGTYTLQMRETQEFLRLQRERTV